MFEITPEQEQELLNRLNMMAQSGSSKSDIEAYNQQYRSENGREKKSPVVKESESGTPVIPPSPSPSKSTFGGSTKSAFSDPFAFLNKPEEETLLPVQKKKAATAATTVATNLNDPKDFQEKMFGVNKFGNKTLRIDRGLQEPQELEIDPRTIPYSPYTNVTDDVFLGTVRFKMINNQPLNKQEEAFLDKNKRPMSTFGIDDENELGLLSKANGLDMTAISGVRIPDMIGNLFPQVKGKTFGEVGNTPEGKYTQIQAVKLKLQRELEQAQNITTGATGQMKDEQKIASLKEQLDELDLLETKAIKGLTKISNQTAQGTIRTDNTGNNFNRFVGVLQDAAESGINIVLKTVMPAVGALMPKDSKPEVDKDVELRVEQLPSQAFTGLSFLKYKEPVEFARVTRLIAEGKPISETQIANLTNIGIEIEKEKLKEDYNLQVIDKTTYDKNNLELSQKSYNNLVGNKEVLRSFLSSNIADVLDEIEKTKIQNNVAGTREFGEVFGMRWQYTDEEIDYAAKVVAKANGLNADDPRVKEAIKYLQDNEGAMIMQNSISKSGFTRDFFKGAAMPIRGIVATVEGIGKTSEEKYAEAQSQGNVNVSETPVKRIANSWEGTAAKVFEGAGQLVSQAGLAYLTGGAIGGAGRAILGRGGVAALEGDIALADMTASDLVGAGLTKGKDFLSTFVTTFASTYDNNLKQAQTYTADDGKAMAVAGGLSGIEALAENALSPLDIARGVGKTLFGKTSTQKIINILDDAKILDKKSVIQEYLTGTLKAGLASGRMVATEIGEEEITALADYGTNMILNPNSQSFKNRVLKEELFETGIETGLSMVIPALLTGVGAFNTNSFAKGSLIIAAQNRQMIVDALDKNLADGLVTQDEYNKKLQIVNSASKANQELPLKADGYKLNSEEKANYIYSRVSEGALERKIEVSTDEAEKTILRSKIAEQQKSRETILNTPTNVQPKTTQNVSTQAQNNQGQQGQDNQTQNATPTQDAEVVIDEEAVAVLEGLTPTGNLSDFEINMMKGSPKLAYEMIADQALGFGRVNGVRQPIPEAAAGTNEQAVREKYGDAVVDKALQLYPLQTNKTNNNENQKSNTEGVLGGVREEGNKNEGGEGGQQLRQGKEEMTVAQLRTEEQKDLAAAIPNIESYKVDGKVDKTLIKDETELATYNEIFDRYDKLITPKLEEEKAAVAANPALKDVESTTKALDADKIKKIEELADIDADPANLNEGTTSAQYVANLYHLSKADDSNPELVSAVESVLSKEQTQSTLKTEQDAIQKQTAGEVPVQSRATVGETMEEGIPEAEPQSVAQEGEAKKEVEQQIEDFGVAKKDVGAVYNVISKVFQSLKKGGLTALKNVGEWVGIGKGEEKTYALKIDGKEIQVRSLGVDVVNGFYSPLEKIIKEAKVDKLPAKQWSEKYANSEEARVTGLKDWLSKQEGSVSKADIQQYLKDNRISVVEVVKEQENAIRLVVVEDPKREGEYFVKNLNTSKRESSNFDTEIEAQEFVDKNSNLNDDLTKFSQYQLEGEKENYKEVLVTLPNTNRTKNLENQLQAEYDKAMKVVGEALKPLDSKAQELYNQRYTNLSNNEKLEVQFYFYQKADEYDEYFNYQKAVEKMVTAKEKLQNIDKQKFNSSHYDEPNILVHLRMNTRTSADGSKVLFLEEIQSDWGQKGKKEGFKDTSDQESTINKSKEKISEYNKSLEKLGLLPNSSTSEIAEFKKGKTERTFEINKAIARLEKYKDTVRNNRDWDAANKEIEQYETEKVTIRKEILAAFTGIEIENEKINNAERSIKNAESSIPSAPFVTDTNSWVKLGLKVALKEAVKQGADKIAWTTGEQQNQRYDLSKSVKSIQYIESRNAKMETNETYTIRYEPISSLNYEVVDNPLSIREIESMFGKDIAEKIANGNGETGTGGFKVLKGENLSVGGRGMKGFYGSPTEKTLGIVGNVAKSLFKQEPKTVELDGQNIGTVLSNKEGAYIFFKGDNVKDARGNTIYFKSFGEAEAYRKKIAENTTQQSIDITPELKASVDDGLPLFKKGENEKDFGGFQTRDGKPIGYTYDTDKVARERFDISKLKKIGSGSDRDVYDLGDGRVLKIAKTARGLTQNIYEGDYYLKGIIPEVTERGLNYVVAENTPRIKTSDVVEIFDEDGNAIGTATAGQMLKELQQFSQRDFDNRVGKLQDVLYKYGFYDIMNYDVLWGDFIVQRNWGYKDGKAYHSDGGTFGGVDMITSYRGKTNMSDPEFRKIYEESKRLKKEFGDTDKATMYKEEEGKVQAQYRIESGKNVVEAIEEFNGSPKAVVALTHEIMHPTVVAIVDGAKDGNEVGTRHTQTIVDEFNKANPDNTITTEELIAGNEEFKQGTTTKKYRDVQEFIAENWEKYHTEGAKGFSKAFQEVLEQISKAFQAVYSTLKGEQVTPELRQMFDEILGKDQTTNNGATATATNQPVSTTEGTTQQQGGQEAVQQGTTDAGQAGARTTPTIRPTVKRLATDGTELVTLSGLTEEERQDKIAERKKKTGVSERVIEEQALLDDIKAYEALMNGNRGKTSPQGLAQLNRLRNRIAEYNRKYNSKYRYDDRRGVLRGNTGKTVKRIAIDSEKAIVDGQVLSDRSPKTQKIFQELFSASAMPTAYMANGIRMSAAQLDGVIDDIVDGIPSRRATNYLNSLENQIEQDDFDFSKSGSESQESRPKTPLSFVLNTEFEFVGEPMTQEALESWLADEADLEPEFEQIVTDNIDNLITDYEQEGTATANEEPIPATEAKDSGKPKQDSKEGGKGKGDEPKPSPKPKPSEPDAKEPDAVKKARDKKIEDFNNKVDANAKALIDFLTPKGMEGVKKSGLGVAEIVNNASKIIKAAYATSQNIKDAVQKGIDYFIANWDENELGELPVEALRAKLEADLSDANDGVGITHAATASTLNEFALPEYKKEAETFAKWDAEAAERIKNGEMPALIEKLKNYSEASPVEVRMLGMYIANLKEVASRTKSDEDIAKMYEAIKLSDSLGSKEGKSLVARKGLFMNGDTLADYFQEEMDAIGVDVLTEEQKSEIEKEYEAIKQAKDEWEKERERLNKKILEFEAQAEVNRQAKEAAKKGKSTKTTEDFSIERQKIVGDIREKLKKVRSGTNATIVPYANELFAIAPDVAKLVKSLVEQGVVTLTDLVSEVKANLIGEIPQITDSDVRDLISGAYNEKKQTKSQLAKEIFDLKEEARLTNKWAALQAGDLPKTNKAKIERNKQIKELREKIEKFRRDNPTDKESLDAIKKSYETRIKKLEDDLRTGNFLQNPVVKPPVKLDKEAIDAKDKLIKLKNERKLRILKAEYENRTGFQKKTDLAADILNIPRALMTTLDLSAVLRQGIIPTVSGLLSTNPSRITSAIKQMFKSAISQKEYDRWFADLEESPNYELMIESGLALTDNNNPALRVREEAFMSNIVSKYVPLVKGSERAYSAYLNKLRVDMFNGLASSMEERGLTFDNNEEAYKQMAKYVNNATGRGGLPKVAGGDLNTISPLLNGLFFSPRLISSRLNMLTYFAQKRFYDKVPKEVRVAYFSDMVKFIGTGVGVLFLASLAGGGDDEEEKVTVEFDLRSSDFAKIRSGDTRWDIWGGFQPYVRLMAQVITGQRKSTSKGTIINMDGEGMFNGTRGEQVLSFTRGKLSPVPSIALDIFSGRTAAGEKVIFDFDPKERSNQISAGKYAAQHLLPLTITSTYEAVKEDGLSSLLTVGLTGAFGIGTQKYGDTEIKILDDLPKVGEKGLQRLEEKGIKKLDDLRKYKGKLKTLKYKDDDGKERRIFTNPQIKSIDSIFSIKPKAKN